MRDLIYNGGIPISQTSASYLQNLSIIYLIDIWQ